MAHALTAHTLHFSDVRLQVECNSEPINDVIVRDWGAATHAFVGTMRGHHVRVHVGENELEVTFDEEQVWRQAPGESLTDAFELILYRRMLADHGDRYGVFHGAAVVSNGTAWVLCGPSNAGKSSLSVAALKRGYQYYTDEFVVTDGKAIWGWPRTPQFGALPGASPTLPMWLTETSPPDAHGTRREIMKRGQVACAATPAEHVHFVAVAQGASTRLQPSSSMTALRQWSEAAFFEPPVSLGKLVGMGQTWEAEWRHPDELLDALELASRVRPSPPHTKE
ncbi:MAG: hypothetical protein WBG86_02660, partial [Polyangiales bacterium]